GGPNRSNDRAPAVHPERSSAPTEELAGFILALPDGRPVFRQADLPSHALSPPPGGDAAISPALMLSQGLRPGDFARVRVTRGRGRPQVVEAVEVAGWRPDVAAQRPKFDNLTAIHP